MRNGFGVRELALAFLPGKACGTSRSRCGRKSRRLQAFAETARKAAASRRTPNTCRAPAEAGTDFARALRRGWPGDPRAGVDAETVSAAQQAAGKDAASAGRQRRRSARAA